MTTLLTGAMFWINMAMLAYFVVLNVAYTSLLVLGWWEGNRYVERSRFADLEDMRVSPLTTPISILVPAYNEELVIVESVRAMLAAEYPQHEVIVINDGSKDDTLQVLIDAFHMVPVSRVPRAGLDAKPVVAVYASPHDARLLLVDKKNGGKADAINAGLNLARYPLFCTVDSDTIIDDDALLRLVRPFQDEPETVACGGVVRIANGSTIREGRVVDVRTPRGLLENIQIVEYLRAFLAGRAGWARIGALMIISGAFGMFRRDIVVAAGGYDTKTVGEDAELVVRLHRYCRDKGIDYKAQFLADPVCWTQAPDRARILARQRDRWHRGLIELLWKHRSMVGRRRYGTMGTIAMPYHVVFEGLGPLIEMLGYAVAITALVLGIINYQVALALLALSLSYGLILSFGALIIEDRAYRRYNSWTCVGRMIVAALVENFGYRQWASFVRAGAFITLFRRSGWGEMTRVEFSGVVQRIPLAVRVFRATVATVVLFGLTWGLAMAYELRREGEARAIVALFDRDEPDFAGPDPTWTKAPRTAPAAVIREAGLQLPARATPHTIQVATNEGFRDRFWTGVNIGSTTPGHKPGEVTVGYEEAHRWFAQMGMMGIRVVRVYTILPPGFYRALREYNLAHPRRPIYFIQGVWIPEVSFMRHRSLYHPDVSREFRKEMRNAVGVIHGDIRIAKKRGHASGNYTADVSMWLAAWSPGIEWDPEAIRDSDRANITKPVFRGRYIRARENASPTESWLAANLNYLAGLEAARGWSRPMTFSNWVTTDPLEHPDEPLTNEDLVGVDAMNVEATKAWPGGFFASYHIYPYYPDFLRWSTKYTGHRRADGKRDPYAGYLAELRKHHRGQAVMVTEFGQPTGIGIAHRGPLRRDQGGHSEPRAMHNNAEMLESIRQEGYAGGVLFAWTDEWFKHTWNTMEYDLPAHRRSLWSDVYTNEQHFGLLAHDPGSLNDTVLDGSPDAWAQSGRHRIYDASRGEVRRVDAFTDPRYLHLRIETATPDIWKTRTLSFGFDVTPGGNGGLPSHPGLMSGADLSLEIGPGRKAQFQRPAWLDPILNQYGPQALDLVPGDPTHLRQGSGVWVKPRLVIDKRMYLPGLKRTTPTDLVDISQLGWGPGNPDSPSGDVRNLIDAHGRTIEVRIPWRMLGFSDPSSHQVLIPRPDGTFLRRTTEGIQVGFVERGMVIRTTTVRWKRWDSVVFHERPKQGIEVFVRRLQASTKAGIVRR